MVADTIERADTVACILGRPVASMHRMAGGRNSLVYQVECTGPEQYLAKFYVSNANTGRGRLEAEYGGLKFLWEHGERAIPRPVAADSQLNCAVYEYVHGTALPSPAVTESDIQQGVDFLVRLKILSVAKGSGNLPPAAEACFSTQAIIENLETRRSKLEEVTDSAIHGDALQSFFQESFDPTFARIAGWCSSDPGARVVPVEEELGPGQRTLSPSDFGFHNSVKQSDGRVIFLDFEYFGWDDPAKMIADFLLHPAMNLPPVLKQRFFTTILQGFDDHPQLGVHVKTVYPLFGLKWCLIMLNEFIPDHLSRRGFAEDGEVDAAKAQAHQLSKAELMLKEVISSHDCFPYQLG